MVVFMAITPAFAWLSLLFYGYQFKLDEAINPDGAARALIGGAVVGLVGSLVMISWLNGHVGPTTW